MEPVLLSTLLFIPKGQTEVVSIRFFLSDHGGVWNTDSNDVFLNHELWGQWKDCRKDQHLQKKFFDGLKQVSNIGLR